MEFLKKVVIITGGTSGIGFAAAKKFLEKKAVVIAASLDTEDVVRKAMAELHHIGEAEWVYLDVTEEKSCNRLVNYVINKYGKIDVLVNAAGVRGKVSPPLETDFDDFERTMRINLTGAIRLATLAAAQMKEQRSGTIIHIGSISGSMVTADDYGYHCSKCALDMAAKILAHEVSPFGVRCISLAFGGVKAGMNSLEWEKEGCKLQIKQRLLHVQEAADIIYLATTEEASAINGSVLMADDGYTAFKGIYE